MAATVVANAGDTRGLRVPEELITRLGGRVLVTDCSTETEFIDTARDADAVIMFFVAFQVSARVMDSLPNLRHIANTGVGFDGVDVLEASRRGIAVTNNPHYCLDEVANQAFALLLGLSRRLFEIREAIRGGSWGGSDPRLRADILPHIDRIDGQVLGIIGLGNIGRTLARKAKGFGLEVIACDPYVPRKVMRSHFGVEKVALEELLERSDYVSLHTSLTSETKDMIGADQLRMMKPTAHLINTARGAIVDEMALISALAEGRIAGAGLDVSEQEPMDSSNPLLSMKNVIVSGHTAFYSNASQDDLWNTAFENVGLSIQGVFPKYCVNPEVEEQWQNRWEPLTG